MMTICKDESCVTHSRRSFLGGAAALGGAALGMTALIEKDAAAQTASPRIDTHHHILPPEFVRVVGTAAVGNPAPNGVAPTWSPTDSINLMNANQINKAYTSVVTTPVVQYLDDAKSIYLARVINTYAAQMKHDYPGRFGALVTLPLPNVAASLNELNYAFDTLHAEGVSLMTSYADILLGDPQFSQVFDALNARHATVFVHPTSCTCSKNVNPGVRASTIEFPIETTRTVISLMYNGVFTRCPNIKFIFSHAGGTLPFLANRINFLGSVDTDFKTRVPQGALAVLQSLYYDTALSTNPISFPALLKIVPAQRILYGTDFPFAGAAGVPPAIGFLGSPASGLSAQDFADVMGNNAVRLLGA